jgi:hypothetical protein
MQLHTDVAKYESVFTETKEPPYDWSLRLHDYSNSLLSISQTEVSFADQWILVWISSPRVEKIYINVLLLHPELQFNSHD